MPPSVIAERAASPSSGSKRKQSLQEIALTASPTVAGKGKGGKTEFTWQEVAQHNTAESAWVIVNGNVYDVTDFVERHPGGRTMILLAAGRECSDLFSMYHVLNEEKARKYLEAYKIGTLVGPNEFPSFAPDKAGLYSTLKKRVRDHFKKTGENPTSPVRGLVRILPVIFIFFAAFIALNHPSFYPSIPTFGRFLLCVILGVGQALPLLHWMHDASHGSIGKGKWNDFFGQFSLDWFAGASIAAWHHQHILGHHVYTNCYQCDPDLPTTETGDMRRIVPKQKWAGLYKYQHLYLPVLYFLLAIKVRISDVTDYFMLQKNGPIRVNFHPGIHSRQFFTKSLWVGWRFLLPIFVFGASISHVLLSYLISDLVTGGFLAYNFQVSHVIEEAAWPNGEKAANNGADAGKSKTKGAFGGKNKAAPASSPAPAVSAPDHHHHGADLTMSWAENQIRTSVDYGHDSAVWGYLCGHLNYQIEHHLFPGISQYHYPAIAPIVKQTCKEFGLPYIYKRTFFDAIYAHFHYLYVMGQQGKQVHMD